MQGGKLTTVMEGNSVKGPRTVGVKSSLQSVLSDESSLESDEYYLQQELTKMEKSGMNKQSMLGSQYLMPS